MYENISPCVTRHERRQGLVILVVAGLVLLGLLAVFILVRVPSRHPVPHSVPPSKAHLHILNVAVPSAKNAVDARQVVAHGQLVLCVTGDGSFS